MAMKPRELSREECIALLAKCRYGRLGLSQSDQTYIIPMSYVYSQGRIFLHSRGRGKKLEFVTKNPRVCFQIDTLDKNNWSSVLAYGIARLSDDIEAKKRMFEAFTEKGLGGHGGKKFQPEELERMPLTVWEISIEELTGREGVW
ncbi:Pyridoxamine 5'-phosphate oxidase [uncultured archaeon]|nr:Pyridoxamine 5'-phosphate oxidase [uncultured archaeon]